jgi:hypothetical protein
MGASSRRDAVGLEERVRGLGDSIETNSVIIETECVEFEGELSRSPESESLRRRG